METREEYKRKIALCDKLGAKKFQHVVLKVEELKIKVIKKIFPRYMEHFDKYCDKNRDKALKKAKTEEERNEIIKNYRNQKIAMRKEFNREQNRNYHMDENKPTEFLYYLNWNKSVHKKGLIRNAILLAALSGGLALGIFPEGTRNRTKELLQPFKFGAVSMAKKTNATIVPYAITGTYKFRTKDLKITFGEPFKVGDMDLETANEKLYNEILNIIKKEKGIK